MKNQIQAILDDDRGVSPVIGVILMVAITVILAAVIGTFVLGLGDSLQQAPSAQLSADVTDSDELQISHNGGDAIAAADFEIAIEGKTTNIEGSSISDSSLDDGEFNVGDTITTSDTDSPSDDTRIRLIHTPSESILLDTEVTFSSS